MIAQAAITIIPFEPDDWDEAKGDQELMNGDFVELSIGEVKWAGDEG